MDTHVFLNFSDDIQQVLVDNEVDLIGELARRGINVSRSAHRNPAPSHDEKGARSAELVILATGVTAVMIGHAVCQIIEALRGPIMSSIDLAEYECVAERDANDHMLMDSDGNPRMKWTARQTSRSLPVQSPQSETSVSLLGLSFTTRKGGTPADTE
jgi:hypothetical protein